MAYFIFYLLVLGVSLPNLVLPFTDPMPALGMATSWLLPTGLWWWLASLSPRLGRTVWLMLPLSFLAAFNMVLLDLYGCGVIAVDMWLNLVTTNAGEVGELLSQMVWALAFVAVVYLPPLAMGVVYMRRGTRLPARFLRANRRVAGAVTVLGTLSLVTALAVGGYNVADDLYPVNVCHNLGIAVDRSVKVSRYDKTSASFRFGARPTHPDDSVREVYLLIVGETSRAQNWQLSGYGRETNPLLSRQPGVVYMPHAVSESNTTHKAVPMLLSHLTARDFDKDIYTVKGIAAAAREAGFHTAFISNQRRNGSFIDFFGAQADTTVFLKDDLGMDNPHDLAMLEIVDAVLARERPRELVILHCYGSHFDYRERYLPENAHFLPDQYPDAAYKYRPALVNAYDNSIRATDRFLAAAHRAIEPYRGALIYTSDHGEDLFDEPLRLFLHASPRPTVAQVSVPMLIWPTPGYAEAYPGKIKAARANSRKPVSTSRSYFPTALDLAGIRTAYLDTAASLVSPLYKPVPRTYLNDHNEGVRLEKILRNK